MPRADNASSVPSSAVVLRMSSVGFTSTRSRAISEPDLGNHLHQQVRLAIVEPPLDRRAHAGRDGRVADVEIERHVDARGPVAHGPQRLGRDCRDAEPIDVLHREDVHAGIADELLFAIVEIAHADQAPCAVEGRSARNRRSTKARRARDRAAPRAACRARCRSACSPACSCRRARRPTKARSACPRRARARQKPRPIPRRRL